MTNASSPVPSVLGDILRDHNQLPGLSGTNGAPVASYSESGYTMAMIGGQFFEGRFPNLIVLGSSASIDKVVANAAAVSVP